MNYVISLQVYLMIFSAEINFHYDITLVDNDIFVNAYHNKTV